MGIKSVTRSPQSQGIISMGKCVGQWGSEPINLSAALCNQRLPAELYLPNISQEPPAGFSCDGWGQSRLGEAAGVCSFVLHPVMATARPQLSRLCISTRQQGYPQCVSTALGGMLCNLTFSTITSSGARCWL